MNPYYEIWADGAQLGPQIKQRLLELKIEDQAGVTSDKLTIELDDRNMDISLPPLGSELSVRIGYLPKENHINPINGLYNMGKFTLTELAIDKSNGGRVLSISGHAVDLLSGIKTTRHTSWHRTTLSKIVFAVGERNGFSGKQIYVHAKAESVIIPHITQDGESDMSFLSRLAKATDFALAIKNNILVFTPTGDQHNAIPDAKPELYLSEHEALSYHYGSQSRGTYANVRAFYGNTDERKTSVVLARDGSNVNSSGVISEESDVKQTYVDLPRIYPNITLARQAAETKQKQLDAGMATFSFSCVGRPDIVPDTLVILSGFRWEMPTRWEITKVTHTIARSGYVCDCETQIPANEAHVQNPQTGDEDAQNDDGEGNDSAN